MEETHKHKGLLTNKGALRSHPVSRKHKDKKVQQYHNLALANEARKSKTSVKKVVSDLKKKAGFPKKAKMPIISENEVKHPSIKVDDEDYIILDLTKTPHRGVKVKFIRQEGRKRRIVGLKIEA